MHRLRKHPTTNSSFAIIIPMLFVILLVESLWLFYGSRNKPLVLQADNHATIEAAQSAAIFCRDETAYDHCYQEKLSQIAKVNGLVFSRQVLEQLWDIDDRTRSCHAIAHRIALAQIEKLPSSWDKLLATIDPQACSGGFFHGILEGHTRFDSSFQITDEQITKLCDRQDGAYSQGSCLHIMGHLLLVEHYPNLKKAIAFCDGLTLPSYECYSGIFMENITRQNLNEHGLASQITWTKESSQTYEQLCASYQGEAAKACWGNMGFMYAAVYNDDADKVYELCSKASREVLQTNCYMRAVEKIAVTGASQSQINSLCNPYKNDQIHLTHCMVRVVSAMLTSSVKFYDRGTNFCAVLPNIYQKPCYEEIKRHI